MAGVTIQLVTAKSIPDKHNVMQSYTPGDWVTVGKHAARQWLANGTAQVPEHQRARDIIGGDLDDCGILILSGGDLVALVGKYPLKAQTGPLSLPYNRTLVWSGVALMPVQTVMGFTRLERVKEFGAYEVAAMLADNKTAAQVGSDADRAGTLSLICDLRLPVYNTAAVWIRRNETTERMVASWADELAQGVGPAHAFLRAVYTTQPALCSLPANWMFPWWEK